MPDATALVALLRESATRFTDSFRALTPAQLAFRPAPGRWTIAETAEHVVVAEVGSGKLMRGRMIRELAPDELLAATTGGEQRIDRRLSRRDTPFTAPDFTLPTGRWPTAAELVRVFDESRTATIELVASRGSDLTRYAAAHPALGPLDGLQWAYFLVRHCLRHVEQIEDNQRANGYPTGA